MKVESTLTVIDEAANQQAATEFVDGITNMTTEEAVEKGLLDPPEYSKIPVGEELQGYIKRMRAIPEAGVDIKTLGDYILREANKVGQPSKNLTVGDWKKSLEKLESAKTAGTLKELVKEVKNEPLSTF